MMIAEGSTHVGWGQLSILVGGGVKVGIERGSTGSVEVEEHCLGVAPSVEQTLLVAKEEVSPVVNITVFCLYKVQEEI